MQLQYVQEQPAAWLDAISTLRTYVHTSLQGTAADYSVPSDP